MNHFFFSKTWFDEPNSYGTDHLQSELCIQNSRQKQSARIPNLEHKIPKSVAYMKYEGYKLEMNENSTSEQKKQIEPSDRC